MSKNIHCIIPRLTQYDWGAVLILFLLTIFFNPQLFFLSHIPLDGDSLLFFYPLRSLHADPHVGLWNPYLFSGFPREANPQSQLLYPFNLVFLFFSTTRGYSFLLIFHLFLGSFFLFILLRSLRCQTSAALLGAVAFLVSTYWRCKITNLGLLEGITWIPALLFCYLHALERQRWIYIPLGSLFFTLIFFAGVPHTVLYVTLFLICISIAYIISNPLRLTSILFYFGSLLLFTLYNTIAVWLPAAFYAPNSARMPLSLEEALSGSLQWGEIWRCFFGGLSQPEISRCDPWESTCYIGVSALILIPFAWKMIPRRILFGFIFSFLTAILFTLGQDGFIFPLLYQYIPGFSYFNMPNRSLLMAALILPILSGLGFQRILNLNYQSNWVVGLLVTIAIFAITILVIFGYQNVWVWNTLLYPGMTTTFNPESITPSQWAVNNFIFWLVPSALILIPLFLKNGKKYLTTTFFILLITAQSYQYNQRLFLQTTSPDYFNLTETIEKLKQDPLTGFNRICSYVPFIDISTDVRCKYIQPALMHRLPEVYRQYEIQGYDPLYPKRYAELIRAWAEQSPSAEPVRKLRIDSLPHTMLDFLGVKHVIGFPNQKRLFTGQFELNQPDSIQSPFAEPNNINKISIRWIAAGAFNIPQGTQVGNVHIVSGTDETQFEQTFPIRMGIEIANYIIERHQERARHRAANIFRWFPIPSFGGYDQVQQYVATFELDETVAASAVAIEWFPQATLIIREIDYYLPDVPNLEIIQEDSLLPLYENPKVKGPVYLSRNIIRYENVEEIVETLQSLEIQTDWPVFISRDSELTFDTPPIPVAENNWATISIDRRHSDKISITINTKFDAVLAINENISGNWNATLDKEPAEIIRANHNFMAITVPAGEHIVQLNYMPRIFYIACSISIICIIGVIILILLRGKKILSR